MNGMNREPISIVGGGLAGLTLGILLRQQGISVVLHESGAYPRNKVCGEFVSGMGQTVLENLGIAKFLSDNTSPVSSVAIFSRSESMESFQLPVPALAVRRLDLDLQLAIRFQEVGGDLRAGARVQTQNDAPGLVVAAGRRPHAFSNGYRFYGLKSHFTDLSLSADLELHFGSDGYVGLLRLPNGHINVCGLFRSRKTVPDLSLTWREKLSGEQGSILHSRMSSARLVEGSFCSVAALGVGTFRPQFHEDLFSVGDSMLMIPPFTGNGMSIAFETAALAVAPLLSFHKSGDWEGAKAQLFESYRNTFRKRMRNAYLIQGLMFQQSLHRMALQILRARPSLFDSVFKLTR